MKLFPVLVHRIRINPFMATTYINTLPMRVEDAIEVSTRAKEIPLKPDTTYKINIEL